MPSRPGIPLPPPRQRSLLAPLFPVRYLPARWARKLVKLRHWLLLAVPIGLLTGLGVAGLNLLCNSLLWDHLGAAPVPLRLAFPVLGLGIHARHLAAGGFGGAGPLVEGHIVSHMDLLSNRCAASIILKFID